MLGPHFEWKITSGSELVLPLNLLTAIRDFAHYFYWCANALLDRSCRAAAVLLSMACLSTVERQRRGQEHPVRRCGRSGRANARYSNHVAWSLRGAIDDSCGRACGPTCSGYITTWPPELP